MASIEFLMEERASIQAKRKGIGHQYQELETMENRLASQLKMIQEDRRRIEGRDAALAELEREYTDRIARQSGGGGAAQGEAVPAPELAPTAGLAAPAPAKPKVIRKHNGKIPAPAAPAAPLDGAPSNGGPSNGEAAAVGENSQK